MRIKKALYIKSFDLSYDHSTFVQISNNKSTSFFSTKNDSSLLYLVRLVINGVVYSDGNYYKYTTIKLR